MSSIHEHDEIFPAYAYDDDIDDDVDDASLDDESSMIRGRLGAEMRRCCFSTEQDCGGGGDDDDGDETSKVNKVCQNNRKSKGKGKSKKSKQQQQQQSQHQHSLDHLQHRVSELMSIFQEHDWFIPLPNSTSTTISEKSGGGNKGKVKSNRNYGADKKRQRKHAQRQLLEMRIQQLESCLKLEHGLSSVVSGS
jgi:hypothetical protein